MSKKELTPLDKLQHTFNDVMEDLAHTTRRAWDEKPQTGASRQLLETTLQIKIDAHHARFTACMEAAYQEYVRVEPGRPGEIPCEYCSGQGSTPADWSGLEGVQMPCIACDGSGRVEL